MFKNKFVSSSRKAFTLLELLAALAIAAVLVVALMGLFSSTVLTETTVQKSRDRFEEARLVSDTIATELRRADQVLTPTAILLPEEYVYLPFLIVRSEKSTTQVIAYGIEDGNIYRLSYRTNRFRDVSKISSWDSNRSNLIATDIEMGENMGFDASIGLVHLSWRLGDSLLETSILCEGARP